ncbi:MAG: hypothetical protein AB7I30_13240 [Isosphaeraceae bacterium]
MNAGLTWGLGIVLVLAVLIALYVYVIRPWHMSWGATAEEVARPLPDDGMVPHPKARATHGVTLPAPAAEVWPWLAQIGQGRGGFYSYDWLENLFGCDIHNVDRIVPEFQDLKKGDGIKLHPKAPALSVVTLDPPHALVICGGKDLQPDQPDDPSFLQLHRLRAYTWAFVLEDQPDGTSRFLARVHADWAPGLVNFFRYRLFLEPAHSIMQRKMNLGLRACVASSKTTSGSSAPGA